MKFITYRLDGRERPGVMSADSRTVIDLAQAGFDFADMTALISASDSELLAKISMAAQCMSGLPLEELLMCAPLPRPRQDVICLGKNYAEHAKEAARYSGVDFGGREEYPIYFSKRVNEAVPDGGVIPSHRDAEERLDYEAELAVIIGREAKHVEQKDAYDYVFGYTIINDVSARVTQNRHKQWYFGKSMDGFLPMGPWIVTVDEIPGKPVLSIKSRVNGELRQNSSTGLMIFDVAYVISDLSRAMTLLPGTVIATGTPAGVGMGFDPPRFLHPGDTVECEIEKIGVLRNVIG